MARVQVSTLDIIYIYRQFKGAASVTSMNILLLIKWQHLQAADESITEVDNQLLETGWSTNVLLEQGILKNDSDICVSNQSARQNTPVYKFLSQTTKQTLRRLQTKWFPLIRGSVILFLALFSVCSWYVVGLVSVCWFVGLL